MENSSQKKKLSILSRNSIESLLCCGPTLTALKIMEPEYNVGISTSLDWFDCASLLPGTDFVQEPNDLIAENTYNLDIDLHTFDTRENPNWKNYLECSALPWKVNPYHAIDLLRKVAGVSNADVNFEFNSKFQESATVVEIFVGLNEASLKILLDCDSFSKETLLDLIDCLEKTGLPLSLLLCGSLKHRKTAKDLQKTKTGSISLINLLGKTGTNELATVAKKVDLCITGPGLTALLSSGFGTFTYCVDFSVHPDPLYYPYGHGHIILQPGLQVTNSNSDELFSFGNYVAELLQYTVRGNGGLVPSVDQWTAYFEENFQRYVNCARAFITQRVELEFENQTKSIEQYLKPLCYLGAEAKDAYSVFYRLLWEFCLSNRVLTSSELEILHDTTLYDLRAELTRAQQLCEVATFGVRYSALLARSYSEGTEETTKKELSHIDEVNQLILQIAEASSLLAPLAYFHANAVSRLNNFTPEFSAKSMQQIYSSLQTRTVLLLDLVKDLFHNYNETKPTTMGIL